LGSAAVRILGDIKGLEMRVILCKSTIEAVETVSSMVIEKIQSHPRAVIGLATGRTMEPVYASWVKKAKEENISHENCFFFMLDEYLGLKENHPSSFKSYIQKNLIHPLHLVQSQFSFPPVHLKTGGDHYEINLKECGGIDLQLLGIGQNGHVGFNEPGSDKNSMTRVVKLTAETIEANRSQFPNGDMPSEALSMGIKSIMAGKSLIMLATGKSKAETIKYLVNHHDDPACPATFLKSHPHFTLVLDPDAASKINLNI
jgi:glucosamine-6-phosphate deaminase